MVNGTGLSRELRLHSAFEFTARYAVPMLDLDTLALSNLADVSRRVRRRELSPVEVVGGCLARIDKYDRAINSFIAVYPDEAIAQAREAEQEMAGGRWRGSLHGIPVAIKDLIDIVGKPTTAASALFLNNVPNKDAEVVSTLRAAGAVIIGKSNLHEFAYGGSGVISHFGPVRNPKDMARITGGSSSGSAAAVAKGFCFAAIGTDTAGSIRLPAACCGVVGLKPQFGRISATGVVPLSWSYDHVGPIARTVEDVELVFRALVPSTNDCDRRKWRIGVARNFFFEGVAPEILNDVESTIERLSREVESVRNVDVPIDEDRTVSTSESWEYHKQFMNRAELYDPRTLVRIRSGERFTAEDIARKSRDLERLRASTVELFRNVDVILSPTVPVVPPRLADLQSHPETLRATELLMLRNTRPWNVYGIPAVSVPCGKWAALQIAGLSEDAVLRVARLAEREQ
jgi:Asp-tRNA(Asn)/Glu-tRNA(Gln) amidotransferase A subunit family amidase